LLSRDRILKMKCKFEFVLLNYVGWIYGLLTFSLPFRSFFFPFKFLLAHTLLVHGLHMYNIIQT
jgi:hypothetical protein